MLCLALLGGCAARVPVRTVATKPAIERTEPWTFGASEGQLIQTQRYRLFTTANNPIMVQRAPRFLEDALEHYRTAITDLPAPAEPVPTFIMSSRPEWKRLIASRLGAAAERYLWIQKGGFVYRDAAYFWDVGVRDTLALCAHEGWHQYTNSVFSRPLPTLLEEGLACYMEGFGWNTADPSRAAFSPWNNLERFERLRDRRAAYKEPLLWLSSTSPEQLGDRYELVLDWYAGAWALSLMLADDPRYRPGLERMLTDRLSRARLAPGGFAPRPLLEAYFGPLDQLDQDLHRFIRDLTATGAKNDIVRGSRPRTLEVRDAS